MYIFFSFFRFTLYAIRSRVSIRNLMLRPSDFQRKAEFSRHCALNGRMKILNSLFTRVETEPITITLTVAPLHSCVTTVSISIYSCILCFMSFLAQQAERTYYIGTLFSIFYVHSRHNFRIQRRSLPERVKLK